MEAASMWWSKSHTTPSAQVWVGPSRRRHPWDMAPLAPGAAPLPCGPHVPCGASADPAASAPLVRNAEFPAPPDLLNLRMHFHKLPRWLLCALKVREARMALTGEGCRLFFHLLLSPLVPRNISSCVFSPQRALCSHTRGSLVLRKAGRAVCFREPLPPSGKKTLSTPGSIFCFSRSARGERRWSCQGCRTEAPKHQEWWENAFCGPTSPELGEGSCSDYVETITSS